MPLLSMVQSLVRVRRATLILVSLAVMSPNQRLQSQSPESRGAPEVTLRAVLDSVRLRSPMLDAARARAHVVRGVRMAAGTFENPMLTYQVDDTPFPGGRPLVGMYAEHITTATVPLSSLYQRGARVAQADASIRAADAETRVTGQRVALDAARAYYRTALAEVGADAAGNLSRWLDSVVIYNRTRVQQGVTSEADLIRSEVERDRALADASMAAAELARARADLSMYIGDPVAMRGEWRVAVDDRPLVIPTSLVTSDRARFADSATNVRLRPEVIAARERLSAATAATSLEQRLRLRELAATFGVKRSGGVSSMVAGVSVPLPLFDQNRGALSAARAAREVAGFELVAQERSARADLLGAQDAARLLTERATELAARDSAGRGARYLARADDARAIALGAYREGAASLLQVMDAARAWGEARLTYYRTLYAQHEAVLALLAAHGDDVATALPTLMTMPLNGTPR